MFIKGLEPQWVWRAVMAIFGAVAYMGVAYLSLLEMQPLIGGNRQQRYVQALRLSKVPYFAGGIVECLAGLLNPQGMILVLLSAAASTFGGSSGLLWAPEWLKSPRLVPVAPLREPLSIRSSWGWRVAAVTLAVAFILFLGPGVRFTR